MFALEQPTLGDCAGIAPYIRSAGAVQATTGTFRTITPNFDDFVVRSYLPEGCSWSRILRATIQAQTESSVGAKLIIGKERPEDTLVSVVAAFSSLKPGWDGEGAPAPCAAAIDEAIQFLRLAPALSAAFDPTLHANGSVLLEFEGGGVLEFQGDGTIRVSLPNHPPSALPFAGTTIPASLRHALAG